MKFSDKRVRQFIFLNLYLIAIYFLVFFSLKTSVNDFIMFSSPDSQDYLSIGNWIFDNTFTDQTLNNPVLYPFLLKLLLILFGVKGVWFVQFLFWLASVNLLFYSIKRISNKCFAYIGVVIFSCNLSYIALTLHALTDVTVTFLICCLIFYLTKNHDDFKKPGFFYVIILFFSFLTIIKPVFLPPLFLFLFIIFPVFYFRSFLKSRMKILLIIVLLPVIFQMSLVFTRHNTFLLYTKGTTTFKIYFFAKCYAEVNKIKVEEAVIAVENNSSGSMLSFLLDNKVVVAKNFFENIILENITGQPTFLIYPPGYENKFLFNIMKLQNLFFLSFHLIFLIPCLYLFFYLLKTKSTSSGLYCFLLLLFYYLVLITGIAFWQGDRYTISFQPLWIIIYLFVIRKLYFISKLDRNRGHAESLKQ